VTGQPDYQFTKDLANFLFYNRFQNTPIESHVTLTSSQLQRLYYKSSKCVSLWNGHKSSSATCDIALAFVWGIFKKNEHPEIELILRDGVWCGKCDVLTVAPIASNCPLPAHTTDTTIPTDYRHKDVLPRVILETRNVLRIPYDRVSGDAFTMQISALQSQHFMQSEKTWPQ
jgi:hypothetical protein